MTVEKYGVIFYKGTSNIGDDIQTFMALRFLPKIDYIIEREELDTFVSKNHEMVKVIMNGWFFHNAENWPISPFIYPLLISMHFTSNLMISGYLDPYNEVLSGFGCEFLKKYAPIGCRDNHTMKLLNNCIGQDLTYFSSCLTTTVDLKKKKKNSKIIYAVDVDDEIYEYIKNNSNLEVKRITHVVGKKYQELSFDERMKKVENLLTDYYNAHLIVTSRLHASLPCLGLKTPVLLIKHEDNLYPGRLESFYDFTNSMSKKEFLSGNYDVNHPIKNPTRYLEYRDKLISSCEEFINKKITKKVSEKEYIYWLEKKSSFQKEGFIKLIKKNDCIKKDMNKKIDCIIENFNSEKVSLNEEIKYLKNKIISLENELESIHYSKFYRIYSKLKRILNKFNRSK